MILRTVRGIRMDGRHKGADKWDEGAREGAGHRAACWCGFGAAEHRWPSWISGPIGGVCLAALWPWGISCGMARLLQGCPQKQ